MLLFDGERYLTEMNSAIDLLVRLVVGKVGRELSNFDKDDNDNGGGT